MQEPDKTRSPFPDLSRFAPLPDIVLVRDLALALDVTERTARGWMRSRVPARKVAGRWIVERRVLLDALRGGGPLCADCCRALPLASADRRPGELPVCESCRSRMAPVRGR